MRGRGRWGTAELTRVPAFATPRSVVRLTTFMFVSGGTLALLLTLLPGGPATGAGEVRLLASLAIGVGLLLLVIRDRLGGWALHAVLLLASAMITRGMWVTDGDESTTAVALLYLLVVVNAFSCSSWLASAGHLAVALTGMVVTLSSLPGSRPAITAVVAGVLVVVCVYTGRIVRAASAAEVDALTGLTNRRGMDRHLEEVLARSARTGDALQLAVLDLDHLKRVNDEHGHAAGDALLRLVAQRWSALLPAGVVLGRTGGDEFVVTAAGTRARLVDLVEQMRSSLPAGSTCSAGIGTHRVGESASGLLSRVDEALYVAKRTRRGTTVPEQARGRGRGALLPVRPPAPTAPWPSLPAGAVPAAVRPVADGAVPRPSPPTDLATTGSG